METFQPGSSRRALADGYPPGRWTSEPRAHALPGGSLPLSQNTSFQIFSTNALPPKERQKKMWVTGPSKIDGRNDGDVMENHKSRAFERRNSQPRRDYNLPSNGNVLPRERLRSDDVAKGQAEVLQGVFGNLKSPAKEMARETGLNERACRNQLAGLNSMNLADFFNACQTVPELRSWGARMMGLLVEGDPDFQREFSAGRQEIVLRLEAGGLSLGKGGG